MPRAFVATREGSRGTADGSAPRRAPTRRTSATAPGSGERSSDAGRISATAAMAAMPGTLVLRYTEGVDRLLVWAGRDGASVLRALDVDADLCTRAAARRPMPRCPRRHG